jgi:hypothetical protein
VGAVTHLIEDRNTAGFAARLAPVFADWQSILSTNMLSGDANPLEPFRERVEGDRRRLESSAKELLARSDGLQVDFSKERWNAQAVPPKFLGATRYTTLQPKDEELPYVREWR